MAIKVQGIVVIDDSQNVYASNIYSNNASVLTTSTVVAGTDTAVTVDGENIIIWNNSSLQSVTDRGSATTNAVVITNTTNSTSTTTGALVVDGGVGIGSNLIAGGYGRFNGSFDEAASTTTTALYVGVAGTAPASPRVAFANSGTTWQIDNYNGNFRWYTPGVVRMQLSSTGTLNVYANTNATSTTTGALIVSGGTAVGGNLHVGGNFRASTGATSQQTIDNASGTVNLDFGSHDHFLLNMSGDVTLSPTNLENKIGCTGNILFQQDVIGGRIFNKPSSMKTPLGGATIVQVTASNSLSLLTYYVVNTTTIIVNYIGDFA